MRLSLPLTALVVSLALLLAGCGGAESQTAAQAPETGRTPRPSVTPSVPAVSPVPTATATAVPTSVAAPVPTPTVSPSPVPLDHPPPYIVAIDPGHGGPCNFGAAHFNSLGQADLRETELTLEIALKLDALLREAGYQTLLTRDGDYALGTCTGARSVDVKSDIQARVDRANAIQADVLVSIHFNGWVDASQSGTEVYYNPDRPFAYYNYGLAFYVQQLLVINLRAAGYTDVVDRGLKYDSQVCCDPNVPNSYLLGANPDFSPSLMPGVIGEALFLTNEADAQQLLKPEVRDAIAKGYKDALDGYFGWLREVLATP